MQDKANYMSPETFDKVLNYIPQLHIRKWLDDDVRMLFKILYWCALRPIEGIMLKKEDFNLDEREIYLGRTKTKKEDYAPITKIFINELGFYLDTKENGRLFPELTYDTMYRWIIRIGIKLNIPSWTTLESVSGEKTKGHIFRKSVGKDMDAGLYGKDAKKIGVISKQMRHKKISTTMDSYLKLGIESVKEAW